MTDTSRKAVEALAAGIDHLQESARLRRHTAEILRALLAERDALRVSLAQAKKAKRAQAGAWTPTRTITDAEIKAARTPAGAWTKATLAQWGVPWPPPRGWRKRLTGGDA